MYTAAGRGAGEPPLTSARAHKPPADGVGRGLGTVTEVELTQNLVEMVLNGALSDDQLCRDLLLPAPPATRVKISSSRWLRPDSEGGVEEPDHLLENCSSNLAATVPERGASPPTTPITAQKGISG